MSIAAHQRAAVRHHINSVSFYVEPNMYVSDGRVYSRRGPRSKYNMPAGSVFETWPKVFKVEEIEKMRAAPKGAKKRK